jgi:hypothetical protein
LHSTIIESWGYSNGKKAFRNDYTTPFSFAPGAN